MDAAVALVGSLVALVFRPSLARMESETPAADTGADDLDLEVATA